MIFDHKRAHREGEGQYKYGTIRRPINTEVQFRGILKILEEGSKEENRLVIIFNLGPLLRLQ